jgi:hypothetical protein
MKQDLAKKHGIMGLIFDHIWLVVAANPSEK